MTDNEQHTIRRTIHFSGTVQGVGFRYTARNLAANLEITGFVRNLRDGRVEVVVEGTPEEVARFEQELEDHLGEYISEASAVTEPSTGEFASFDISF
jgi:acylphosphatase